MTRQVWGTEIETQIDLEVSFILIFLPANATFSVDAYKNEKLRFQNFLLSLAEIKKSKIFEKMIGEFNLDICIISKSESKKE